MGLLKLNSGQVLHSAGHGEVHTLEVLIKGRLKISGGSTSITVDAGGLIGIVEKPGSAYIYTYEALEDSTVCSYPFESVNDIPKIVRSNPKVAPILAAQTVAGAATLCSIYEQEFEQAIREYEQVLADFADYPSLCVKAGEVIEDFSELEEIICPERPDRVPGWVMDYCRSLKEQEETLRKSFYPASLDICVGMVMFSYTVYNNISDVVQLINEYRRILSRRTLRFTRTMKALRIKLKDIEKQSDEEGTSSIVDALATILSYAGASNEKTVLFEELVNKFKNTPGRYDSSDEARLIRKNLSTAFYDIYQHAFLKSLTDDSMPIEVKMFFMFGFVDEELAGPQNTALLLNMAKSYAPDPSGNVLTLYEWLKKVYLLLESPSRNEFDRDWPTYLRDLKNDGSIDDLQYDEMLNNPIRRLDFEIKNFFALGSRMTFGRSSSFVPVFDKVNVLRPLDTAYQTAPEINRSFNSIRKLDYSVFSRQYVYSNPEIGIAQLHLDADITPYMILMPCIGSRPCLWQETDGKSILSRGRMIMPILYSENTSDAMIKLFGEFRWEMCKTVQGVHWNDATDPSITSLYCDYLQFYKKNYALSSDNKEKIRSDLKKYSGNFRSMFIADYLSYIRYESQGIPRLNKVVREIFFTFCPFSEQIRDKLAGNPLYSEMISRYEAHIDTLSRPVRNAITKLNWQGIPVPEEFNRQLEFLGR